MASLFASWLPKQHETDKSLSRSNPLINCSCGEMEGRRRSGYLVEIQEAASECRARELRGTATLDTGCGAGEAEQRTRRPPRPQHRRRRPAAAADPLGSGGAARLISGLSCGTEDLGRAYLTIVYGPLIILG